MMRATSAGVERQCLLRVKVKRKPEERQDCMKDPTYVSTFYELLQKEIDATVLHDLLILVDDAMQMQSGVSQNWLGRHHE